jgi:hypothetical protein
MKLIPFLMILLMGGCLTAQGEKAEILVFVIDTGISPKVSQFEEYLSITNSKSDLIDEHGHGTHITGSILFGKSLKDPVCKEVKVVSCRFFYKNSQVTTADCFRKARLARANFVNFSGGGVDYMAEEHAELKSLVKVSKVVVAAGNERFNLKEKSYYPASLNLEGMEIVANGNSESDRAPSSNYGLPNLKWVDGRGVLSYTPSGSIGIMEGTSQAAALRTHELVKEACQRLRSSK